MSDWELGTLEAKLLASNSLLTKDEIVKLFEYIKSLKENSK